MKNKKVVIRVDGNSKIGLGHLYRGIALAQMLKNDFDIEFITRPDSDILPIQEVNFKHIFISSEVSLVDEPAWLKEKYSVESTILVLDGYYFDEKYQKKIKDYKFKLVYVDDLVSFHQYADLVINHAVGVKIQDYSFEDYTTFAIGAEYALLRPEFLQAAKQNRPINTINTAFVCFGGADPLHLTEKALKALLSFRQLEKTYVLVGKDYKLYEINKLNKTEKRITILQNLNGKELFETISKCNFAITSASTILYELFAVKIPVISGYYVDNQIKYYNGIKDMGMIINADNLTNLDIQDYIVLIKDYLDNFNPNKIISKQQSFIDGESGERIKKLINFLGIKLRNVNQNDLELLYNWVNDNDVRNNAVNSKKINFDEHKIWFNKILNNENDYIFILEDFYNTPLGQIRFNLINNEYIIDYSIELKHRGKGLGKLIIKEGIKKLSFETKKDITLIAYVKKENIASFKIFENLGFKSKDKLEFFIFKKNIYG